MHSDLAVPGGAPILLPPFAGIGAFHSVAAVRKATQPHFNDSTPEREALRRAIRALWPSDRLPAPEPDQIEWLHDAKGKPFVRWHGSLAVWAESRGLSCADLEVSNAHDGGFHVVGAAFGSEVVGLGVDAVWLPRLRTGRKGRDYLLRLARQFMSPREWQGFDAALTAGPVQPPFQTLPISTSSAESASVVHPPDRDEPLRQRVAAHFGLMEAASKACGTGLRLGIGHARHYSLPKQSLGVEDLGPPVKLGFEQQAAARLSELGAERCEADVRVVGDLLIAVVCISRAASK